VSGLAEVTSPPYDVIFRDKEDQLMAADPHNVVRLILPLPQPGLPGREYQDAAACLRRWLAEQILVADPEPALYVYEQGPDGNDGGSRRAGDAFYAGVPGVGPRASTAELQRGLIGALRLVPPQAGIVLPHEDTSPGPVAERLTLMEATQANLEPIFLLYDGHDAPGGASGELAGTSWPGGPGSAGATAQIIAQAAATEPLLEARTGDRTAPAVGHHRSRPARHAASSAAPGAVLTIQPPPRTCGCKNAGTRWPRARADTAWRCSAL
jgi:hypothetical protein